jgi:serine/threonine protein kinase
MSAEHCLDEELADARSDLYSLGCVFYRCLTGQPVFSDTDPVRKILRHALQEPNTVTEIDPEIPHAAAEVISMLIAKEPDDRYQQADDVVLAVESLMSANVEQAIAVADVNPEFLKWAATSSELTEEENIPTVVSQPEFFDFLEFIAEKEDEETATTDAEKATS